MLIPIVLAAALMNAAMVTASAVSTMVIADAMSPKLAGLPNTAAVLGTAVGAMAVGWWTGRSGRGPALRLGYCCGVVGGALTVLATVGGRPALLFVGMFVLGFGNAASLLSRYAAAESVPRAHRARAMSTVVWASTVGAAGGPFLMAPSQSLAASLQLPALAGPFIVTVLAAFGALLAAAHLRPTLPFEPTETDDRPVRRPVRLAISVMTVGHVLMVLLMTAVPVHAHHHGDGLGLLGLMLSAHTLGMFALSPLTGWWLDRSGPRPVMLTGLVLLPASAVLLLQGPMTFTPALFLLGYAWNLCYLGGSAQLTTDLESKVDSSMWAASAIATAVSPWLFTIGGFTLLAGITATLAIPLLVASVRAERRYRGRLRCRGCRYLH